MWQDMPTFVGGPLAGVLAAVIYFLVKERKGLGRPNGNRIDRADAIADSKIAVEIASIKEGIKGFNERWDERGGEFRDQLRELRKAYSDQQRQLSEIFQSLQALKGNADDMRAIRRRLHRQGRAIEWICERLAKDGERLPFNLMPGEEE